MAQLGRWTGGAVSVVPTTSFAVPTADIFPSEARNDDSAYSLSSHVLTLPGSDLADGYLVIARFRYDDDSNGRVSIAGRFTYGGLGNFVNGQTGGYSRNNNNDDSWVSCFGFLDNPSASDTITFQWERESDAPTNGTLKASLDVIPLYYTNHGIYSGTSTSLYGGTTPNVVTIGSTVDESDTAAIERATNVVTVKGDNKRYLVISSQWYQDRGEPSTTRTQRIFGHDYDGSQDLAAQSYAYYRQGSADGTGGHIFDIIETVTADRTIEMTCYLGDGTSSGDGGGDVDGQAPSQGAQALVVLELDDDCEVFRRSDATGLQALDSASPLDLNAARTNTFTDSGSWVVVGTVGMENNSGAAFDALTGANVWAASTNVGSSERGSFESNITVDGTEETYIFHGNYIRGNQTSEDTFGWAANPVGFVALADNEDLGVSTTQTGGDTEHATDTQAGTVGFWGINLDTMEGEAASYSLSCEAGSYSISGATANLEHDQVLTAEAGSYALTGTAIKMEVWFGALNANISMPLDTPFLIRYLIQETGGAAWANQTFKLKQNHEAAGYVDVDATPTTNAPVGVVANADYTDSQDTTQIIGSGTFVTPNDGYDEGDGAVGGADLDGAGNDEVELVWSIQGDSTYASDADTTLLRVYEGDDTALDTYTNTITITWSGAVAYTIDAVAGTYAVTGQTADLEYHTAIDAVAGSYAISGQTANLLFDVAIDAAAGSYAISGQAASLEYQIVMSAEADTYIISGQAANLEHHAALDLAAGAYTIAGQTASLVLATSLAVDSGTYVIAGQAADLEYHTAVDAEAGTYTVSGTAANLEHHAALDLAAGAYTITGQAAGLELAVVIVVESGTYTVTGQAADLKHDTAIDAAVGSYTLTGSTAGLEYSIILSAEAGSYITAGQAASLEYHSALDADIGSYTITGTAVNLEKDTIFSAEAGAYTIAGQAASLEYQIVITAADGSYVIVGTAGNLEHHAAIDAEAGAYAIAGTAASLERNVQLAAAAGAYTITGQTAALELGAAIDAETGSYAISGQAAALVYGSTIVADAGAYDITGQSVELLFSILFDVDAGSYTYTGTAASLEYHSAIDADAGSYSLAGAAASLQIDKIISAAAGTYTTSGQTAELSKTLVAVATSGTYTYTGLAAGLLSDVIIVMATGGYDLSGQAAFYDKRLFFDNIIGDTGVFTDKVGDAGSFTDKEGAAGAFTDKTGASGTFTDKVGANTIYTDRNS